MDVTHTGSRIEIAQIGRDRYIVALIGEPTADALRDALFPLTAHDGATVVVDLAAVSHVAPSLLPILTDGADLVNTHGGRLAVVTRDPRARWLLDESGFSRHARVEPTLNDAITNDVLA
jgi:anti-anti-sigma factor